MPTWRCPHCGAPQPESARCWVCKRSSTSCSTCRHFRRAVAGQLGFCGLDRKRSPLTGDELRGCWTSRPAEGRPPDSAPWASRVIDPASGGRRSRVDFVPIGEADGHVTAVADGDTGASGAPRGRSGSAPRAPRRDVAAPGADPGAPGFRWMLWDDAES